MQQKDKCSDPYLEVVIQQQQPQPVPAQSLQPEPEPQQLQLLPPHSQRPEPEPHYPQQKALSKKRTCDSGTYLVIEQRTNCRWNVLCNILIYMVSHKILLIKNNYFLFCFCRYCNKCLGDNNQEDETRQHNSQPRNHAGLKQKLYRWGYEICLYTSGYSSKAYNYVRETFGDALPCVKTIQRHLNKLNVQLGFRNGPFEVIAKRVEELGEKNPLY